MSPQVLGVQDDSSTDEAGSSLGESSYDFIDDRSVATTDDESQDGMTASTTSSDLHDVEQLRHPSPSPNRASLGQSRYPAEHPAVETRSDQTSLPSPQTPILAAYGGPDPRDDSPENSEDLIIFEENSIVNFLPNRNEVSYALTGASDLHFEGKPVPNDRINVVVRQCIGAEPLNLHKKSFKVLFHGSLKCREVIIQKIATSLAVSTKVSEGKSTGPNSSKFNVVPISSFGGDNSPDVVLIDSSGIELEVEDCVSASYWGYPSDRRLQLKFANGDSVMSVPRGQGFAIIEDWLLPDLAILQISEDFDFTSRHNYERIVSFMRRHSVQTITIQSGPQQDLGVDELVLEQSSPHTCLVDRESRKVKGRRPVDLETFLRLDPGQMNRNWAYFKESDIRRAKDAKNSKLDAAKRSRTWRHPLQKILPANVTRLMDDTGVGPITGLAFTFLAIWVLTSLCVKLLPSLNQNGQGPGIIESPSVSALASKTPVSSSELLQSLSSSSSVRTSSSNVAIKSRAPDRTDTSLLDVSSLLIEHSLELPNKSEDFKVQVLGDCHIILRPPGWYTKMRKPPPLLFKVSRMQTALDFQTLMLFDGVYALQLPRDEAFGTLEVQVWTETRLHLNQSFEVDFGSSWLKIAGWRQAARSLSKRVQIELAQVETSLSVVYDRTKTEWSSIVQKQRNALLKQQQNDTAWFTQFFQQASGARKNFSHQLRAWRRTIAQRFNSGRTQARTQANKVRDELREELSPWMQHQRQRMIQQIRDIKCWWRWKFALPMKQRVNDLRSQDYRDVQKALLKTYWRLRGIPTH